MVIPALRSFLAFGIGSSCECPSVTTMATCPTVEFFLRDPELSSLKS